MKCFFENRPYRSLAPEPDNETLADFDRVILYHTTDGPKIESIPAGPMHHGWVIGIACFNEPHSAA